MIEKILNSHLVAEFSLCFLSFLPCLPPTLTSTTLRRRQRQILSSQSPSLVKVITLYLFQSLSLLTPRSTAMSKDLAGIRQALERARNCEDGSVDPQTIAVLEAAIAELWTRIQADPDSYVLSRDEFALFNYFLERYRGSTVAQRAVARFWNNYHGSPNAGAK